MEHVACRPPENAFQEIVGLLLWTIACWEAHRLRVHILAVDSPKFGLIVSGACRDGHGVRAIGEGFVIQCCSDRPDAEEMTSRTWVLHGNPFRDERMTLRVWQKALERIWLLPS